MSLADNKKTNAEQPSEEQVATYLSNHPGFFLKHEDLLANIKLSHASGSATSLLERQVNVLRERNIDVRSRLGSLLENAVVNDSLFDKSQSLVLAALETKNTASLCKAIYQQLLENFDIDFVGINLFHAEPGVQAVEKYPHPRSLLNSCCKISALPAYRFFLWPITSTITSTKAYFLILII